MGKEMSLIGWILTVAGEWLVKPHHSWCGLTRTAF